MRLLYAKVLAPNDNSKNQPYFGGDFSVLNILSASTAQSSRSKSKDASIFKAKLDFAWLSDDGSVHPQPHAQLILYAQYPEVRFRMMASIRGADTKPERMVRSFLHREGLRFRLHTRGIPGRPDLVFSSRRAVVFVHGCFWNRHAGCRYSTRPKTNAAFWSAKFRANTGRDKRVERELRTGGWRVFVVWECQVSNTAVLRRLASRLSALVGDSRRLRSLRA